MPDPPEAQDESPECRALMEDSDIGHVTIVAKPKELRTIECPRGRLVKETKDGQWVIVRNRHGKVPTYSTPFDDWDEACQDAMHHEPASA